MIYEEIKDEFDCLNENINYYLNDFEIFLTTYLKKKQYINVENFKEKLIQNNLYTDELEKFINEYVKYY